jgi:ATP-dependent exoDNAse (exonuclease V) beta subunit
MGELTKISFSKMQTYEDCPYRYFQVYEKGLTPQSTIYEEFGTAIHETLEQYCKNKCHSKDDLIKLFKTALLKQKLILAQRAYGRFYNQGLKLLYEFPIHEINHEETIDTEYQFDTPFDEKIKLNGYIDRLRAIPDGIEVIDYKTGQPYLEKHFRQILFYGNVINKMFKVKKITGTVHYLKFGKKNYSLDQKQFDMIEEEIKKTIGQITRQEFGRTVNEANCIYCAQNVKVACGK